MADGETIVTLEHFATNDIRCGDQFWRPHKERHAGGLIPYHAHRKFPHAVVSVAGWHLVLTYDDDGRVLQEIQIASAQYIDVRDMLLDARPFARQRPVRRQDGHFLFLRPNDPVPPDCVELPFQPNAPMAEVKKGVPHAILNLVDGCAHFCSFAFRDPNNGVVTQDWNGYMEAFE